MERFTKIVNDFYPLAFFAKRSILDFWLGFEYAYASVLLNVPFNFHRFLSIETKKNVVNITNKWEC